MIKRIPPYVYHIFIWVAYVSVSLFASLGRQLEEHALSVLVWKYISFYGINALLFYVHYSFLVPRFLIKKWYVQYGMGLIASILIFPFLHYTLYRFNVAFILDKNEAESITLAYYLSYISSVLIYVIGATAIRFAVDNWNEHKKAKELEREKTQAELNFLKAQVNPHFLFNAFNSLYALSLKSDNRLPEAILHLSELMRYVLDYSQKETALLQEEIEMIENYIDIQKIRLDDQFDLRFHQKGNTSDVQVTPLVLLPIIENCFKHSDLSTDGFIYFNLIVKDNRIFFTAQNKIETSNNGNASGLKNLEKRLQLRYNHDYLLETNSDGETYTTSLELPAYDA